MGRRRPRGRRRRRERGRPGGDVPQVVAGGRHGRGAGREVGRERRESHSGLWNRTHQLCAHPLVAGLQATVGQRGEHFGESRLPAGPEVAGLDGGGRRTGAAPATGRACQRGGSARGLGPRGRGGRRRRERRSGGADWSVRALALALRAGLGGTEAAHPGDIGGRAVVKVAALGAGGTSALGLELNAVPCQPAATPDGRGRGVRRAGARGGARGPACSCPLLL